MKVGMITLGCAKNTVDTEIMLADLKQRAYQIVSDPSQAEVLVINTCGFIEAAKRESLETILEMAGWKQDGDCQSLIVTGCLTQRYGKQIMEDMPEVNGVLGTGNFHRLDEVIQRTLSGERVLLIEQPTFDYDQVRPRLRVTPAHSAYVKIAEGCDNRCSYCAIPLVRGGYRSRKQESILSEVAQLAAQGTVEINLIAQDTTRYGQDRNGQLLLPGLLRSLLTIPGPSWFRLLYGYPTHFTDELIELLATEPRLVKYLDVPLQHISSRILREMNRPDDVEQVRRLIRKLRQRIPDLTLRTTFIVGFPGEQESDVQLLAEFMQEMEFDHVGVFAYSQEEGTAAAQRQDQVPPTVREQRRQRLMALQQPISRRRNQRFVGRTIPVLVEGNWPAGNGVFGRGQKDAPEVDGLVYVHDAQGTQPGTIIDVEICAAKDYDLVGVARK
ncbi:MAG: 30S ribosomal protein S12 methylthiotransferase RimO [Bacillota bacterium]